VEEEVIEVAEIKEVISHSEVVFDVPSFMTK